MAMGLRKFLVILLASLVAEAAAEAPGRANGMCPFNRCLGENPESRELCGAFNASAATDLSFYIDASLLYWYAGEGGLLYATNGILSGGTLYQSTNNQGLFASFDYKPGFKIGVGGLIKHEWVVGLDYTWLRGKNSITKAAPTSPVATSGTSTSLSGTPVWVIQNWFIQPGTNGQALAGTRVASSWHYRIDLIDAMASRPFYQGPALTIVPFGGLRCALIRQKVDVALTQASGQSGITLPAQPIHSQTKSDSWAIGPRFGFEANCLLSGGFRFEGDLAASLLYTRYTKVSHKEDAASSTFNSGPYRFSLDPYSCLRPIGELGLGLGWGRYLRCEKYHIDFSASYDFSLFWSQNMMSQLLAEFVTGSASYAEDLYFHGLTLTGRFDF